MADYTQVHYGTEAPGPAWASAGDMKWTKNTSLDVAIVGGGPGGVFAAYLLKQRFPKAKITLYEASPRLGGKMMTDCFSDGTCYEAGVAELYEYLSDEQDDPLRQLIEDDLKLYTADMKGGCVVLGEEILHDLDCVEECYGINTRQAIEDFHERCAALMPLEKYAKRWQPDNDHPWGDKTFKECVLEEVEDCVARDYILTAVHSDLATEAHGCNGLNGLKNVLMDNQFYMQLYHVIGGIEQVTEALTDAIKAHVHLETRVTEIAKTEDNRYKVCFTRRGQEADASFDAVFIAMPNHWLTQIKWEGEKLSESIGALLAHYDAPAHYLRVSLLYDKPWWNRLGIKGDYWMMDVCNGLCVYDESHRWKVKKGGHVLSFLIGGQDALLLCSQNQRDMDVVQFLLERLPDFMRDDAIDKLVEARVDRFVGSINAQPGGYPVAELRQEHQPEPEEHPGIFLVADYLFDSTLNAALMSASTAVGLFLETLEIEGKKGTAAVQALAPEGKGL